MPGDLVTVQPGVITRHPRTALGAPYPFSPANDRAQQRHSRAATFYKDGIFVLQLAATTLVAATVTLAIMDSRDFRPGAAIQQPASDTFTAAEAVSTAFRSLPSREGLAEANPAAGLALQEMVAPANFPRSVKIVRFMPNENLTTASRMPIPSLPALRANGDSLEDLHRPDGSLRVRIPLTGSLQNPAWSPDGKKLAFTRFRNGYNKGPADVYVLDLATNKLHTVATDGSDNVSQPGSTWNPRTGELVFSSDRGGHDEIWTSKGDGSPPRKLTSRPKYLAYEPSLSPDGKAVVFESHAAGGSRSGWITIYDIAQDRYDNLTSLTEDSRQPNWSPSGDHILYQKRTHGRWEIWLYNVKTKQHRLATGGLSGDKTDATFSPDGRYILYSGEAPGRSGESLLALPLEGGRPIPITSHAGYHGAPSWSPDGVYVAMEASAGAPDGTAGTQLIVTPVRQSMVSLSVDKR